MLLILPLGEPWRRLFLDIGLARAGGNLDDAVFAAHRDLGYKTSGNPLVHPW